MIRYINIKTTAYGIETVDQFDTKDYKTRKEFFNIQLEQRGISPLSSKAFKEVNSLGLVKLNIVGKKLVQDFSHKISVELLRRYCKL